MDYFLTADLMEPTDGEAPYTEQLVRLPGLGLHYTPDERPVPPLERASLGLPPEIPIYWSGQALYKYLPEYDRIYPQIAVAVGACRFIFIAFGKSVLPSPTAFHESGCTRAFAGFGLDANQHRALF